MATVIALYRDFLRAARRLEPSNPQLAKDVTSQVRTDFRLHNNTGREVDSATQAVLMRDGERRLEALRALAGDPPAAPLPEGLEGWKGTVDPDGSDERGRVGQGFPWQQENK